MGREGLKYEVSAGVLIALILIGSLVPGDWKSVAAIPAPVHWVGHAVLYAALAFVLMSGWRYFWALRSVIAAAVSVFLLLFLVGGVLELMQGFVDRVPGIYDLMLNLAGAAGGILCWLVWSQLRPALIPGGGSGSS